MKNIPRAFLASLALAGTAASAAGFAQHPLLPLYPGSVAIERESRTGEHAFLVKPLDDVALDAKETKDRFQNVTGNITRIAYRAPAGQSMSDVYHHYSNALRSTGFEILYNCRGESCSPKSAGRDLNALLAPSDVKKMRGLAKGQRYVAAVLPRTEGDVYASVYCTREEPLSQSDERNVFCNVIVAEAGSAGPAPR